MMVLWTRKRWMSAALGLGGLLVAQAFRLPSPVWDMAADRWAEGYRLQIPLWHLVFTPLCSVADLLTVLSLREAYVLLAYLGAGMLLIRGWRRRLFLGTGLLAFGAWGALVPRPMARLVAENPETLLVDFHSHTSHAHDGRKSFSPQKNMTWHQGQGYNAAIITDHNRITAALEAKADSERTWKQNGYRSMVGEEISLARTHLVILGNRKRIDNRPYDSDSQKIGSFVGAMHEQERIPVIGSLPEYWSCHWAQGDFDFQNWGLDGFEIVNSAPKGLDFTAALRKKIVAFCREKNLFVMGISDNHGYGYATAAWNAVLLPGWQALGPDEMEKAILRLLKDKGFSAVQVLGRAKFLPETNGQLAISPLANAWIYARSLQFPQVLSWSLWIGLIYLGRAWRQRMPQNTRAGPSEPGS